VVRRSDALAGGAIRCGRLDYWVLVCDLAEPALMSEPVNEDARARVEMAGQSGGDAGAPQVAVAACGVRLASPDRDRAESTAERRP